MSRLLTRLTLLALCLLAGTSTAAAVELKEGTYKGDATLEYNGIKVAGKMKIVVKSVDVAGKVTATVEGYNGLSGKGKLRGKMDTDGNLRLTGVFNLGLNWDMKLKGKVGKNGSLEGKYELVNDSGATFVQEGTFDLEYEMEE